MMKKTDTICAISTPAGIGGIAVIRISGDKSNNIVGSFLTDSKGHKVELKDHKAKFCRFVADGKLQDEVVATLFAAPHSYTGEEVVEISCHGSLYVQQKLLQCIIDAGARMAEAGEFTLRAFLNGQLNLSQAEAVADLIESRSEAAHTLAISQMRGGYAKELEALRQELIDTTALLELELDFSEEDLEFVNRRKLKEMIDKLIEKTQNLLGSFQAGNAIKNGVPVAIAGRPNTGKSTLLNALVGDDRAIVSEIAGTTRDTIEERFIIDGIEFRLIDTAGIRTTDDSIEQAGIERSFRAMRQSAITLYITDVAANATDDQLSQVVGDEEIARKDIILIKNKIDTLSDKRDLPALTTTTIEGKELSTIALSTKEGYNMDKLRKLLVEKARKGYGKEDVLLTNTRHYEALTKMSKALEEVKKGMDVELTPDLLVIDLRDALYHLGTITGKVAADEILSSVFSRFCIGK
ncbi:MAG: tRNA uridine-5-carboxymethylaminomethyl(34) synthesis GTPase MnmE [Bacteroidales bacterium]|nr:tRNA uridine-5-carboxymethylaminomethyl(34) synthesis GTPase MnmE [Bacteroidales bacterium]